MTGICGLLVDRGLAIDEKGPGGVTALQLAVAKGRQETASYLVRHGASLDAKDDSGASVLDLLARSGDTRFANELKLAAQMRTK
jgi:ankyrin repeat protein